MSPKAVADPYGILSVHKFPFGDVTPISREGEKSMAPVALSGSGTAGSPIPAPRRPFPLSTRFAALPGSFPVQSWGAGDSGSSCPDPEATEKTP